MNNSMQDDQVTLEQYKEHVSRMYDATDHLFGWLARKNNIDQRTGKTRVHWIPEFIDRLIKLNEKSDGTNSSRIRLLDSIYNLGETLKPPRNIKFAYSYGVYYYRGYARDPISDMKTLVPKVHSIFIGFYFPPEDYPMVDGVYPEIQLYVNDLRFSTIKLDGTHKIYKPVDDKFWYHTSLLSLNSMYVGSRGRPFYCIGIDDSVYPLMHVEREFFTQHYRITMFLSDDYRMYMFQHVFGIGFGDDPSLTVNHIVNPTICPDSMPLYFLRCQSPHPEIFDYPYILAARKIKRAWLKYMQTSRRRRIGSEIKLIPGLGLEFQQVLYRHTDGSGKFIV